MKYAILSTTTDEEYSFFAPITARMWSEIGYKPWTAFYGDIKDWLTGRAKVVFQEYERGQGVGAVIGEVKGCSKALAIKLARWYSCCFDLEERFFKDDDYLLLSDIDLWPLDYAWFNSQDPEKYFHLFNGDIHGMSMHSTCHVGAKAKRWRSLMGVKAGDSVTGKIEEAVKREFSKRDSSWIGRRSDEQFMRNRVLEYPGYPADFEFINRGSPPEGRVDRESWPEKAETGGRLIDAHLLRPGTDPRVWKRVAPLIPAHLRDWAEDYRKRYLEASK